MLEGKELGTGLWYFLAVINSVNSGINSVLLGDLGLERLRTSARQREARGSSVLQKTSLQGEVQLKDKFKILANSNFGKPKDCDPPPETSQYLKEKSLQEILTGSGTGMVSLLTLCTTELMECWLYDGILSKAHSWDAELPGVHHSVVKIEYIDIISCTTSEIHT